MEVPSFARDLFDSAKTVLQALGANVVEVDMPEWEALVEFGEDLNSQRWPAPP
jgi:hypothetical protein